MIGAGVALPLIGWAIAATLIPDPWPARLVIAPPAGKEGNQGFSVDGHSLLTAGANGAVAWDLTTGQPTARATGRVVWEDILARDGQHYAGVIGAGYADREIVWVDNASQQIKRRLPIPGQSILDLSLLRSDTAIQAIMAGDRNICAVVTWDLATGINERHEIALPQQGHFGAIGDVPQGRLIAVFDATRDENIELWDVATTERVGILNRTGLPHPVHTGGHRFAPDRRTLIVSRVDNQAEVWDVAERRLTRLITLQTGPLVMQELRISPDGRTLLAATGSSVLNRQQAPWWLHILDRVGIGRLPQIGEVVLIDRPTGKTLARTSTAGHADFTPDGQSIVTHELNGTYAVHPIPVLPSSHR